MKKILTIMANVYLVCFVLFWMFCMVNIFLSEGILGVQSVLSPFNYANLIVTLISISPYMLLMWVVGKIK